MNILNRLKLAATAGRNTLAAVALMAMGAGMAHADFNVNAAQDDVAMDGFDVVAYFTDSAPAKGAGEHTVAYKGKSWLFSSAENAEKFSANPALYEPQNNGWCAYAVSEDYAAEVDFINGWVIIDDKLYVNWDEETRDIFVAEQETRILQGKRNWPGVHARLQDGSLKVDTHAAYNVKISHPQELN